MSFARNLRNNATPEECALWRYLSQVRPRFTRQLRLGPFVADFACRRARVIVEVDGGQHVDSSADGRRTALLERDGWRVLRFWNSEVRGQIDGVVAAIVAAVAVRLPDGDEVVFIASRAGRERWPRVRTRSEAAPPPAPPRTRGGESAPDPLG